MVRGLRNQRPSASAEKRSAASSDRRATRCAGCGLLRRASPMNYFTYRRGALLAERVPLARIAKSVGTPTYVYSKAALTDQFRAIDQAFGSHRHLICYSVKASSNLALLRLFARLGAGFDIVSGGELARVLRASANPKTVVFAGVGKTSAEIAQALRRGILLFNVESAEELDALDQISRQIGTRAPFAIRVNPEVDAKTHPYIATGLKTSKFGVRFSEAVALYRRARRMKGLIARGLDCHIGSQLVDPAPIRAALKKVVQLYRQLKAEGLQLDFLDVGGGLGITYLREKPPSPAEYVRFVLDAAKDSGATLIFEPGRALVGNAGLLLTRVLYRKPAAKRDFLVVDAGMNDLIRPALYQAFHEVRPALLRRGPTRKVDVVGPVCESADVLAHAVDVITPKRGDLFAVMSAGAYGMSMASNYNSRPRPAEVLVEQEKFRVIRRRESYQDLMRGERA
jgi:diaminopimelate decarboxylase